MLESYLSSWVKPEAEKIESTSHKPKSKSKRRNPTSTEDKPQVQVRKTERKRRRVENPTSLEDHKTKAEKILNITHENMDFQGKIFFS